MALVRAAWRSMLRGRYGVLLIAYGTTLSVSFRQHSSDWLLLEYASRVLLHRPGYGGGWSGFLHVYSQMPSMQIGPPAVLAAVPTQLLNPHDGNIAAALVMMLAGIGCIALVERVARTAGVSVARTRPAALVGGLLLLPMWRNLALVYMHLDDVIVLSALLAAIPFVLKTRWWPAALLLGTAVAAKPWAIVVVPILFALPRRDIARAGLLTFGITLLWWAPFFVADPATPGQLGGVHVPVHAASTFYLLSGLHIDPSLHCITPNLCRPDAPSWMRPVQLVVGFGLALLAIRRRRLLAAPLVGLAARVLLDSQTWPYYGVGPVLMALVWDMSHGRRLPRWTLLVAAGEYANVVVSNHAACGVIRVVMCVAVIYWFAVRRNRPSDVAVPPAPSDVLTQVAVAA